MVFEVDDETRVEQRRAAYWIREWARRRGMSLNRLSMDSKVSSPSLYDLLGLRVTPNLKTFVSLSRALGVEVMDLFQPVPDGVFVPGIDTPDEADPQT